MLIGSLCTGYGGLDLAVERVFGGMLAWQADIDPDASRVMRERFPGVPNLGDLREADWRFVPPVDILCAGWPCQPVSGAGPRKGLDDERWLFDDIARAMERMAALPRLLVLENVQGLLSASEGQAFSRVVSALAALGYVGRYRLVRASDAGACHRRERWFCLAWPAAEDPDRPACRQWRLTAPGQAPGGGSWADAGRRGGAPAAADPGSPRFGQPPGGPPAQEAGPDEGDVPEGDSGARADTDWGPYAPAVRHWGRWVGREAPRATDCLPTGERLSPRFVEWMMGLEDGWVTGIPGLSRDARHKLLGNGVVPQQAELAIRMQWPWSGPAAVRAMERRLSRARRREQLYGGLFEELDELMAAAAG